MMFERAMQNPMKEPERSTKTPPAVLHMTTTVDEMAAELNISRPTAYALVKQTDFLLSTSGSESL